MQPYANFQKRFRTLSGIRDREAWTKKRARKLLRGTDPTIEANEGLIQKLKDFLFQKKGEDNEDL